ncbi:U2 snRNP-associated SURP motif-containing protein-like [Montipora foliosa]|uniref:U2 snRNP-associated SURP motif-containing protein-like n=1 Tax=Montipora foliosa TaxID=591990 RepID=UPI0035F108D0
MAAKESESSEKSLPWGLSPDGLAPGSMKTISQSKLKSFSVGMMNAGLKKSAKSKQDVEEKKKKQEAEAAEVFADFVASFEDSRAAGKTFVRGNTINPETKEETASKQAGALYKPMAKIQTAVMEQKIKTEFKQAKPSELKKKTKEKEKKKSNLELFKEELKRYQLEREIRHKIKKGDFSEIPKDMLDTMAPAMLAPPKEETYSYGSHDTGDPNTTNLYIGNINPAMTEEMLMRLFGKYGPLASVKIMWPRTEEEKARNRNCGFVAYMRRKDGEKALNALKGKEVMSYEMKLGWGKGVPIPPHPIYIPPEMQEDTTPPPPSGLPFNAQPDNKKKDDYSSAPPPQGGGEEHPRDLDPNGFNKETLANAVVKVVIPTERNLLCLVHRMVEFVVREGPMFEAMIMNKELNNPMYRFLFDNQSPEHIYYRWKLFSILQGDSPTKWRTEKFKMFEGGSMWKPPQCHKYTMSAAAFNANKQPVPQVETPASAATAVAPPAPSTTAAPSQSSSGSHSSSSASSSTAAASRKNVLSNRQRDKLEDMLRDLTPERAKIAKSMVFCVNHADCAEEVVECIAESLSILETPLQVKVARLYLVSDILHNCSVKVPNVSYYRRGFQKLLPEIFSNLSASFKAINARMKAENFRKQVLRCLAAWMDWAVYTPDFLFELENVFLGHIEKPGQPEAPDEPLRSLYPVDDGVGKMKADVDGAPLDVDGVPLKAVDLDGVPIRSVDIDGVPLSSTDIDGSPLTRDDIDGTPVNNKKMAEKPRDKDIPHVASKWDRPEWERSEEPESAAVPSTVKEDSPSRPEEPTASSSETPRVAEIDEGRRKKLREIELKVAEYAQKLEAKGTSNIAQQCDVYRAKLLEAIEPKEKKKKSSSHASSPSDSKRKKSRSRSKSPSSKKRTRRSQSSESRSTSRSPARSRSRSPLAVSLTSLKNYESRSPSPSSSRRSRSRSRSSSRGRGRSRSRSRSPGSKQKRKRSRSRSGTPVKKGSSRKKRSRSRSKSPKRKSKKKKK